MIRVIVLLILLFILAIVLISSSSKNNPNAQHELVQKSLNTKNVYRIFSDFATSECCNQNYNRDAHLLGYKELAFTTKEDYTHAILINKAMPKLTIPKENVIGFTCE